MTLLKQSVLIFTTGGTIEKSYCEIDGNVGNFSSQLNAHLISSLRLPYTNTIVHEIMAKDSLIMNQQDREQICDHIREGLKANNPIIVLHGTDTLQNTIEFCLQKIPSPQSPVVFTGAMRPASFKDSDAHQNFTEALMACQVIPPGFYVSFHGRLFEGGHVRKNKSKSTFEKY